MGDADQFKPCSSLRFASHGVLFALLCCTKPVTVSYRTVRRLYIESFAPKSSVPFRAIGHFDSPWGYVQVDSAGRFRSRNARMVWRRAGLGERLNSKPIWLHFYTSLFIVGRCYQRAGNPSILLVSWTIFQLCFLRVFSKPRRLGFCGLVSLSV